MGACLGARAIQRVLWVLWRRSQGVVRLWGADINVDAVKRIFLTPIRDDPIRELQKSAFRKSGLAILVLRASGLRPAPTPL